MALSRKRTTVDVIAMLELQRHPDGAFHLETFSDPSVVLPKSELTPHYNVESSVSAVCFLLPAGVIARLRCIPCAETWHHYMGEPLTIFEMLDDGKFKTTVVGPDLRHGHIPQHTVPPNVWSGAFLTCDIQSFAEDGSVLVKPHVRDPELQYSFVAVTRSPASQFDDHELATRDVMKALAPTAEAFISYLVPS